MTPEIVKAHAWQLRGVEQRVQRSQHVPWMERGTDLSIAATDSERSKDEAVLDPAGAGFQSPARARNARN